MAYRFLIAPDDIWGFWSRNIDRLKFGPMLVAEDDDGCEVFVETDDDTLRLSVVDPNGSAHIGYCADGGDFLRFLLAALYPD